jgi:hypothetical protein
MRHWAPLALVLAACNTASTPTPQPSDTTLTDGVATGDAATCTMVVAVTGMS